MRLNVDLSGLHTTVRRMGAESVDVDLDVGHQAAAFEPIDVQLEEEGVEVERSEVSMASSLPSYRGRQVLLYIQDHGSGFADAVAGGSSARKFHVAYCRTLEDLWTEGRYGRYVATTNLSGEFHITGYEQYRGGTRLEGKARLKVCKNCLEKLNYQGYRSSRNRNQAVAAFDLETFFATYCSFFPHMPRRRAGEFDASYTADWPQVSANYRARRNFNCEHCGVNLSGHEHLLHVHHRDGVKSNNSASNLQALCADCHRKQPAHEHLSVPHEDAQRIAALRREQRLGEAASWEDAFRLADPGVHGLLHHLRRGQGEIPDIGCPVPDRRGAIVAQLELAWPSERRGVAISKADLDAARRAGWRVESVHEAIPDERDAKTPRPAGRRRW